jgi:hypothetical protein
VAFAQNDCEPCSATLTLDANRLLSEIVPQGIKHERISPSTTDQSLLGYSSFWMGGVDPSGNIKFAGDIPDKEGSDFYPGPLDFDSGATDAETCKNWDQFFLMTREIIIDQERLYQKYVVDQGMRIPDDSISIYLKSWPGGLNPYFEDVMGFSMPDRPKPLAPFWDTWPHDAVYNPSDGDFPILLSFPGCDPHNRDEALAQVPDEFAFWMFNDVGGVHSNSQTASLNIEVYAMAFANKSESIIGQTVMHMYKVLNVGEDLSDVYLGLNVNPELGCGTDDFFGIEPDKNLFYTYNQDSVDGMQDCTCADGSESWCEEIPMHGIKFLNRVKAPKQTTITPEGDTIFSNTDLTILVDTFVTLDLASMSYYNACANFPIGNNENCIPQHHEEYYELMQGNFGDGTPVTYSGNGYNPGSIDTTDFVFSTPPDSGDWSMCSDAQDDADRRPILAFGPLMHYANLSYRFSFASFYLEDVDHPCPSLDLMIDADEQLEEYRNNCYVIERDEPPLTTSVNSLIQVDDFEVYPNPFNIQVNWKSTEQVQSLSIYNSVGHLVQRATTDELQRKTINTSKLTAGVYFVRINSGNQIYKIIKTD